MKIIIISVLLAIILLIGILINNNIISKKNRVKQAFGSIEIYLKKRFDLIPSLIATLNKYLAHEKEIMQKITELRSASKHCINSQEQIEVSNELSKIVSGLHIQVENYPDLKADIQFINIQFELSDIEDQISASRRAFNASVTTYNNNIQMFPANIVAGIRKDKTELLLEIPKTEQKEINIKDLLNS
ncbi:LemA family protein [Tenacibaculum sp. nBUS_03]|uniref:LemA family protein n=1 Tax=Tenacibaculum sp. nBUS_03 TaxID=3395320 RepID=UPI003EC010C0